MPNSNRFAFFFVLSMLLVLAATLAPLSGHLIVLNPKGWVGQQECDLMGAATQLMLVVVIPVILLTLFIAWRYREGNAKAAYTPDWDFSWMLEAIWWAIPCVIIALLSVMTWKSTLALDPYKPLDSDKKPLTVQVVALQWKWLFIYPEQKIATVNSFQIPAGRPIHFEITSEAPMNSFWIPELGGQIYGMPGMKTELYLVANEKGSYRGWSANISGEKFASMTFTAKATSEADFDSWVESMQHSSSALGWEEYALLLKPGTQTPIEAYTLKEEGLFDWAIMKYMTPKKEGA
jgi:cytochrome o ubiquinol oxidase subunit 2